MDSKLVQRMAQVGNQIEVTLVTGNQISGILTEIAPDHITINGKMAISVEAVITVQSLENSNAQDTSIDTSSNPSSLDNKVDTHGAIGSNQDKIEAPEYDKPPPSKSEVLPSPDVNTEPVDATPAVIKTSESSGAETESTVSVDFEKQVSEKLSEIMDRFNTEIDTAEIELEPPDLTFPVSELADWQRTGVVATWNRIKIKYDESKNANQLDSKLEIVELIIHDVKSLVSRFPNSPTLKRVLAYFYSISDNWDKALEIHQEVAARSDEADDWFNVVAPALKLKQEELACYSLGKYFYEVSIINPESFPKTSWYAYIGLLERFKDFSAFRTLCELEDVEDDEVEILLESAIYLLKKTGSGTFGTEILQKRAEGKSAKFLLGEICQKLDSQPIESYRQFLTEFEDILLRQIHPEDLYREAELAHTIEKNLERAERLYLECIRLDVRRDSAIMDLAMLYVQLELPDEAVDLLEKNRDKVPYKQQQRLDNLLTTTVYPKAGQYEKAITLLNRTLKQKHGQEKKGPIFGQIANAYTRLEKYTDAENYYNKALELRPDDITVQRSLAFCFSQQKLYNEAAEILNRIQNTSPNAKTAELLEAIEKAKITGEFTLDDSFIPAPSDFSGELSEFAQFFLKRCEFAGLESKVIAQQVRDGKYMGSESDVRRDIARLRNVSSKLGPFVPRERSNYNLSAARIYFDVGDNRNSFYKELCRSFTSRGDAAVVENRDLDAARAWYCEALTVYDGARIYSNNDGADSLVQEANGSLVRYLYSILGGDQIPRPPDIPSINKTVSDVITDEKAFDAIAYLVSHSGYAAESILTCLYEDLSLRKKSLDYLKKMGILLPNAVNFLNDFTQLWNELRHHQFSKALTMSSNLKVLQNFELSVGWLEDNIRHPEVISADLSFTLDKRRVTEELRHIFDTALELCKQKAFGERENRCQQLDKYCTAVLNQIKENPTKLSVEDVYPIINLVHQKVKEELEHIYQTLKPRLTIRLADGKESYVPVDREIDVQIVVENEEGRMPADTLKLFTQPDARYVEGTVPNIELKESLRGGKEGREILEVKLSLSDAAITSKAFSLPVYAEYGIRGGKRERTQAENLAIVLDSDFQEIPNPYNPYAGGGPVDDPDMFFGRKELIQEIAHAIQESHSQSKCVLVYGQYRSGKSSVLYHLKTELQNESNLLIINLANIKPALDTNSSVSILYQILMCILRGLKDAVEEQIDNELIELTLSIPDAREFYEHPTPLQFFEDIFKELKRTFKQANRGDVRLVLLIDEFQYIYDLIVTGELTASFMQDWKALLQSNHFSAVLVGQDVMPKFKSKFANEFGTTQDKRVTYLTREEAVRLIQEPIYIDNEENKSRYREQSVQRIIDLTEGSPYYIQIICARLVRHMNRKRAPLVTESDVEQVKDSLIKGKEALDEAKFHSFVKSGDISRDAISEDNAKKVLTTIAKNSNTDVNGCPRHDIVCDPNLEVDKILADLVRREVVDRDNREFYRIRVGLFKEWLIENA